MGKAGAKRRGSVASTSMRCVGCAVAGASHATLRVCDVTLRRYAGDLSARRHARARDSPELCDRVPPRVPDSVLPRRRRPRRVEHRARADEARLRAPRGKVRDVRAGWSTGRHPLTDWCGAATLCGLMRRRESARRCAVGRGEPAHLRARLGLRLPEERRRRVTPGVNAVPRREDCAPSHPRRQRPGRRHPACAGAA